MCIIAIKPKGKPMFDDDAIDTMFTNNPDGAGYMYYDPDKGNVVIRKGFMTVDSLKKSLKSHKLDDVNVVLHFRISTSGKVDDLNCHPFPVYGPNRVRCRTKLGVAHNGILHDYIPPKKSAVNDTQVFIDYVLGDLSPKFITSANCKRLLGELIGPNNKLAFLDDKGNVTTIGYFIKDNDYVYSNKSYLPRVPKKVSTTKPVVSTASKKVSTTKSSAPVKKASYTPVLSTTPTTHRYNVHDYDDFDPDFTYNDFWSWWDVKHPA